VETCILVDKLEKVSVDALLEDLDKLGLQRDSVEKLLSYLKVCYLAKKPPSHCTTDEGHRGVCSHSGTTG